MRPFSSTDLIVESVGFCRSLLEYDQDSHKHSKDSLNRSPVPQNGRASSTPDLEMHGFSYFLSKSVRSLISGVQAAPSAVGVEVDTQSAL
ncbi:hypothetical protein BDR04DRAFT_1165201 [Suillus decipiens]|nr:hypothetical protein BDR04DRAFT_1165201 [Suillus decipiens]